MQGRFEIGRPKTGGRARGTPNKRTLALIELAESLNVDPFEILLRVAAGDWKGLGYQTGEIKKYSNGVPYTVDRIDLEMRVKAAAEACQYIHPKRKAIETTVNQGLLDTIKSLEGKTEEELEAIVLGLPRANTCSKPAK